MNQMNATVNHRGTRLGAAAMIAALAATAPVQAAKFKVLDFWGVGGFAHGSRTAANTLLDSLAKVMDITIDKTDQATSFTTGNLANYQVVILNNTTEAGKILNVDQRAALLAHMKTKGYVGFHGAGDTKGTWPEYTTYLGGELSSHGGGIATLNIDPCNKAHPILEGVEATTKFDEEWYAYKTNPRLSPNVQVLYTLDEASCPGCTKMAGGDHPIAWTKTDPAGGRVFYYAMGHGNSIFQKNLFSINMLKKAILWAAGEGVATIQPSGSGCVTGVESPIFAPAADLDVRAGLASLDVEIGTSGSHKVQVHTLSGKRVDERSGSGIARYSFAGLRSGSLYSVSVTSSKGKQAKLVAVP
jgi:type 1 glutamine amidotransferase